MKLTLEIHFAILSPEFYPTTGEPDEGIFPIFEQQRREHVRIVL
jgi:hypothetical protein